MTMTIILWFRRRSTMRRQTMEFIIDSSCYTPTVSKWFVYWFVVEYYYYEIRTRSTHEKKWKVI